LLFPSFMIPLHNLIIIISITYNFWHFFCVYNWCRYKFKNKVDQSSIDITIEQDVLTIQGNVGDTTMEGYKLDYQEYEMGDFQRSFTLTDTIDQEKIVANLKNGVLELILPKAEK
jgi:hypothetical protein